MNKIITTEHIMTKTGKFIHLNDFTSEDVDWEDIAHTLAHVCRFGGHNPFFYSVAAHSHFCLKLVKKIAKFVPRYRTDLQCAILLHDACETYISDIPTPVKNWLGAAKLQGIEDSISDTIFKAAGLEISKLDHPYIKFVDWTILLKEVQWQIGFPQIRHIVQQYKDGLDQIADQFKFNGKVHKVVEQFKIPILTARLISFPPIGKYLFKANLFKLLKV